MVDRWLQLRKLHLDPKRVESAPEKRVEASRTGSQLARPFSRTQLCCELSGPTSEEGERDLVKLSLPDGDLLLFPVFKKPVVFRSELHHPKRPETWVGRLC